MANYPRKQRNLRPLKICTYTVSAQPQAAPSVLYNYTDITLYNYNIQIYHITGSHVS